MTDPNRDERIMMICMEWESCMKVICPVWDECVRRDCEHRTPHKMGMMVCDNRCSQPTGAHGDRCRYVTEEERVYFKMLGQV